jgi:hypothetical protein
MWRNRDINPKLLVVLERRRRKLWCLIHGGENLERIDCEKERKRAMESREKEEESFAKLRERKKMKNEIFWNLIQINILSRAITKMPLS